MCRAQAYLCFIYGGISNFVVFIFDKPSLFIRRVMCVISIKRNLGVTDCFVGFNYIYDKVFHVRIMFLEQALLICMFGAEL